MVNNSTGLGELNVNLGELVKTGPHSVTCTALRSRFTETDL